MIECLYRILPIAAVLISSTAVEAQTFRALLGDRVLGTIAYSSEGNGANRIDRMFTNLDNTPLGVGDGTFEAISRPAREGGVPVRQYTGVSASSRKGRSILVVHAEGAVRRTEISPTSERTGLSDPSKVPGGTIDLAQAFGRFTRSTGCPDPFRFYDGRRVVAVRTLSSEARGAGLLCTVDYRVVEGPGHLSPFRFTKLSLDLEYDRQGILAQAIVRAGLFSLRLTR